MVAFRCSDSSVPSRLHSSIVFGVELPQRRHVHDRGVDHLAGQQAQAFLEDLHRAVGAGVLDPHFGRGLQRDRLLGAVEILLGHVGDAGLRALLRPVLHHAVRVLLGELLDRGRGAAVGIAFAQHRIHGRAQHLGEAQLEGPLRVVLRLFGVAGHVVAVLLQFLEGGLQLRDRGRDVRQLDDVRRRMSSPGRPGTAARRAASGPGSASPGSWR